MILVANGWQFATKNHPSVNTARCSGWKDTEREVLRRGDHLPKQLIHGICVRLNVALLDV